MRTIDFGASIQGLLSFEMFVTHTFAGNHEPITQRIRIVQISFDRRAATVSLTRGPVFEIEPDASRLFF